MTGHDNNNTMSHVLRINIIMNVTFQPESQNASVTLKGQDDGNPIHYNTKFPLSSKAEVCKSAPLHRLAAKSQIKTLETEEAGSGRSLELHV